MPWEVTIRRGDGSPLGDMAVVRQQIVAAIPAMLFCRQPSGAEKIAAARALGIEFPEMLRHHFENSPATERAEFEGDGYSVVLYGFEAQPLTALHAEVRGDGNPVAVLAALCRPNGWVAIDDASGQRADLEGPEAAGWRSFQAYCGKAIRNIRVSDGKE